MTNAELSRRILVLVGGKENVVQGANCMTRLRIQLKDAALADIPGLKSTEGILGVVEDDTLQIVLGPGKAAKVCDVFLEMAGLKAPIKEETCREDPKTAPGNRKDPVLKRGLGRLANIFTPLIPAIIAAGLCNGIASFLGQACAGQEDFINRTGFWFVLQNLCSLFGASFLSYFAIFTGVNAAKEFGATPALGGMIGGISTGEQVVAIAGALGLQDGQMMLDPILTTGRGGVIGVIAGVWLLAQVERWIRRHVPDVLDLMVTPLVSLLTVGAAYVLVLMPAAGILSDGLVWLLQLVTDSASPVVRILTGYGLAALFLPLVLLGLHHSLIPLYAIQLERMGGVPIFPVLAMAGAGQVGAAFAIWIKARRVGNKILEKNVLGGLPAGLLGVGEPLLYGVILPVKRAALTACLGAGFGGAFIMLMKVVSVAWGPSGLVALPLIKTPAMMLYYGIGLVIAYGMGFLFTWFGVSAQRVSQSSKS